MHADHPPSGETILVVEDNDAVRAVIVRALRAGGYAVIDAQHGIDALDVASTHAAPIDAVITDVRMPRMSGLELLNTLRRWYPGIRVLLISGETVETEALAGLEDTPTAYLAKPFTGAALAAALRELLDDAGRASR